jgi:hypothetical protein
MGSVNKKTKSANKKMKKANKKMENANKLQDRLIGFDDADDFVRLREVFDQANYTEAGINAFLGVKVPSNPIALEVPPFILPKVGDSPLETLIRLFLLNVPVTLETMRSVLHSMKLVQWCDAGLVVLKNNSVQPLIRILPYNGLLLACDITRTANGNAPDDQVMNISGSTLALANATIRRPVRRTLDLDTGCGIKAFLAANHSEKVSAVDRNPRAISFATFNAQLNGLKNVDFFTGDLFDPVQGNKFDLIVMNPLFVISPELHAQYRDSGMHQDQFCREIVRRAPDFLEEGGNFQMICSWLHIADQPWQDRLAEWFDGINSDVWVMRTGIWSPSDYTLLWNRSKASQPDFGQTYEKWMAYYQEQRIEAISTGMITLRKTSGRAGWFRCSDRPKESRGSLGNDILSTFDANDFLESEGDDQGLMNTRFLCAPDIRLEQQFEPSDKGWRVVAAQLSRTRGLCYSGRVNADIAGLLPAFNGQRRLGDMLKELAVRRKVALENITPAYLTVLRSLISRGFVFPVGFNSETKPRAPEALQEAEPALT